MPGWTRPWWVTLGLAPLSLGLYSLYQRQRGGVAPLDLPTGGRAGAGFGSFTLMLSNSGDSLAVFLPLLSESKRESLLLIVACYLLAALAWCGLSLLIAGRESLARRIERHGGALVPWVLIAVGSYILLDTATDTLV